MTVPGLSAARIHEQITARAKADFVVRPDVTLRYDQLLRDLEGCCGMFDARGLAPGDRVMILTADESAAIAVFTAALLDGLVPVMLTPETAVARATAIAGTVAPKLIVLDEARRHEEWAAGALPVLPAVGGLLARLRGPAEGYYKEIRANRRAPRLPEDPHALAYVLFTSGTTAAPKGVMITRRNLFSHLETLSRLFGYGPDSRIFNGMVLAHGDGLVQGPLLALANGCALIRPGAFSTANLEPWLNSIRALGATHVLSVPTVYALVDRYAQHNDYFDAPECRCLISVAAKLDEGLWRRLQERFERPVFNQYGLTETVASGIYAGPHEEMGPIGTIGKPVDMDLRIVDPDEADVPDGAIGEIWLSGNNVFAGYWGDPASTAEVMRDGIWLRTGDLGLRRPDGSVEIRGRLKTVIMSGGFLIRPEEVDEVLSGHPAVAEAATVGVPDPDFGEVAISAVVLDGTADELDLTQHCRANLEPMKVPKRIVTVTEIPRGDAGKPKLEALRALLAPAEPATAPPNQTGLMVLQIASRTFRVPADTLSLEATPDDVPGWDSFAHINLVLQAERHFEARIPTARVAAIRTLRDLADAIEAAL